MEGEEEEHRKMKTRRWIRRPRMKGGRERREEGWKVPQKEEESRKVRRGKEGGKKQKEENCARMTKIPRNGRET